MASAWPQPVRSTTSPAMAVAMKANRSLRMCWNAPSTFNEVRSARATSQLAPRLTTIPTSAVIRTRPPATFGGLRSLRTASYKNQALSSQSVMPFACAERISTRFSP